MNHCIPMSSISYSCKACTCALWTIALIICSMMLATACAVDDNLTTGDIASHPNSPAHGVVEWQAEHGYVRKHQSRIARLQRIAPTPILRITLEPLLALSFIAGTADPIVATIATLVLLVLTTIVWQCIGGRFGIASLLCATVWGVLIGAQVFTIACWFSRWAPSYRWVADVSEGTIANLHAHTFYSNGLLSPAAVVEWHRMRGFRVVAITDTNTIKGACEALRYAQQRGLEMTIIVGEEFRGGTHLLLLNIRRDYHPRDWSIPELIRAVHAEGGIVIPAHPWTGRYSYEQLRDWGVDAFEVINRKVIADERLWQLCSRDRSGVVASNDYKFSAHSHVATYLPKAVATAREVCQLVRRGHSRALTWSQHALLTPTEFERSRKLYPRMLTLWMALKRYRKHIDCWAVISWGCYVILLLLCFLWRWRKALCERNSATLSFRVERFGVRRFRKIIRGTLWFAGAISIIIAVVWTWTPSLKCALGYYPTAIIAMWLIGDALILLASSTKHRGTVIVG
ncbi:MAG TPA: PHP domain-containing protein [Armatimonadetes bacterium]|nr:PHP domain-containing protein [Armatimonadota bacterium]